MVANAAEEGNFQEKEAQAHLSPNYRDHRLLQTLHYLSLLPHEHRVDVPQKIQHCLLNDYLSADQMFVKPSTYHAVAETKETLHYLCVLRLTHEQRVDVPQKTHH